MLRKTFYGLSEKPVPVLLRDFRREPLHRRGCDQVCRRAAQFLLGKGKSPRDLFFRLAAHSFGFFIRLPDQAGPGFLPLGQAAGAHVREVAVELRHAFVDFGLPARGFLPLLAALDDPILDRLLPAAEGLRHRPGDEIAENPEEGRQVGELPDPHRQSQEPLRGLGRLGKEKGRETHQAHAASLRPRTFSASVRARRRTCPGSSSEERRACAAISPLARSSVAVAAACASASFFSRCARPSERRASRSFKASRRARASSCSMCAIALERPSRLSAWTLAAVLSSDSRASRIEERGRKRNFLRIA